MGGPLRKFRVLELARVFAAPWAGQTMADLGAEVIKIEAISGDPMRQMGGAAIRDGEGNETTDRSVFAAVNRNKKSLAIDIATTEGAELVRRLAARCDVFMENYKVGDLARRGLDYEAIRAINPRIIYMSLTGFGQSGPYRHRPGMDAVIQGLSGYMSMIGDPDRPPGESPVAVIDFGAGCHAAIAILAALIERDLNGGPGQYIDIGLMDTGLAMMGYKMIAALINGEQPPRGLRPRGYVPSGVFPTADGWVRLQITNDAEFKRLCEVADRPDLPTDPRYRTRWLRTDNQQEMQAETARIMQTRTTAEWSEALHAVDIMVAPVLNLIEAANNEQTKARDSVIEIPHERGGKLPIVRNPIRLSETPIDTYRSPPLLGQHADEVLQGLLGMAPAEIEGLRARGVLGAAPQSPGL